VNMHEYACVPNVNTLYTTCLHSLEVCLQLCGHLISQPLQVGQHQHVHLQYTRLQQQTCSNTTLCVPTPLHLTLDCHNFGWWMHWLDALSVLTTPPSQPLQSAKPNRPQGRDG
jgi:hypothetical protein